MSGFDVAEVRSALSTSAVLGFYGWKFKKSGGEFESAACPQRGDHSRRAFVVNAESGRWQCFPCATAGDLFDFIAATERLSMPGDFGQVLAKAAEIAGVGPSTLSDEERRRRRDAWQAQRQATEERDRLEREARDLAAVPTATAYWAGLELKNKRGAAYLFERRVGDVMLTNAVRFDPKHAGSPAVALFTRTGEIRNVVARRVPELGEPKTPGLYQCPSAGTLINSVSQIEADRDVYLTEGVMDSITARVAWPDAIVLGAHGAGNLPKIAKVCAPEVIRVGARMCVVPHRDARGFETAHEAGTIAISAGLSLRKGTLSIVKHGEKDLNDAWRLGWRAA